jgi:hypothetical protein
LSHLLLILVGQYSIPVSLSPILLLFEEKQKEQWLKNSPGDISKCLFGKQMKMRCGSLLGRNRQHSNFDRLVTAGVALHDCPLTR